MACSVGRRDTRWFCVRPADSAGDCSLSNSAQRFSIVRIFYHTLLTVSACSSAQGQGFSKIFFLFPSPPQKRGKERGAGWAQERPTGTTLFITLGWGACCQAERLVRSPVGIPHGCQGRGRLAQM